MAADPGMLNSSSPLQPQGSYVFARQEGQRQDAHAHQVGAMDALEGFGDNGAHAEQVDTLGGPIAAGAAAVGFARQNEERFFFIWYTAGRLHRCS